MNAREHRRLIKGAGSMGVELQVAGKREPWVFWLGKMSKVKT